jgi:phosphatidylserine/phosphatidylglycerophosphate/cardiolipin synthase-like enzyme
VELLGAYVLMDLWLKGEPADDLVARAIARLSNEPVEREPNEREQKRLRAWAKDLAGFPTTRGSLRSFVPTEQLHSGVVKVLDRTSSVGTERDQIGESLIELALQAKKRILIENPYIVLTELMIETLEAVSQNGVEIHIGTNSPLSTDSSATQAFFLEDWPMILARVPTLRFFVATGTRKFHAKVGIIDDVLTVISTYNLDFLSAHVNSEIVAAVWSASLASETMQSFIDDRGDPTNGVLEWTIRRDDTGAPVLQDGRPVVTFGPEHHLSKSLLRRYRRMRWLANVWRKLPWFKPLRHPPLTQALGIDDT